VPPAPQGVVLGVDPGRQRQFTFGLHSKVGVGKARVRAKLGEVEAASGPGDRGNRAKPVEG
jgi:hypothetical protein